MGLLESIFFRDMPIPGDVNVDLDLFLGKLGEIRLGDPVGEIIRKLGPPVSWWYMKSQGIYSYPSLGITITTEDGVTSEFIIAPLLPQYCDFIDMIREWKPYAGRIRLGEECSWLYPGEINPGKVEACLGVPEETQQEDLDAPDGEIVLMYRHRDLECDVEFTPDMQLKALRCWLSDEDEDDVDDEDDEDEDE